MTLEDLRYTLRVQLGFDLIATLDKMYDLMPTSGDPSQDNVEFHEFTELRSKVCDYFNLD